jgi:hypothetical protein
MSLSEKRRGYKIGAIQTFRKFPNGWHRMTDDEKAISDAEFQDSVKDPRVKSKLLHYYCEVYYDERFFVYNEEKTETFIDKAKIVHGDKYDYSMCNYITNMNELTIICDVHGEFKQRGDNHLQGKGCVKCGFITTHKKIRESKTAKIIEPIVEQIIEVKNEGVRPEFLDFLNNH